MYVSSPQPYDLDHDPEYTHMDAELTDLGLEQARELRTLSAMLSPELMVVSPLRRATRTGLIAFEDHVENQGLRVVAHELCHELGGKHTCDKRLSVAQLKEVFPVVDYSVVETEEDPFWGDGRSRESHGMIARRAGRFMKWLRDIPEKHVVVATHSQFLLASFNAVLDVVGPPEDSVWFGTGEMRSMKLTFGEA